MPQPDQPYAETVARLVTQVTGHRGRLTTLEQRADATDKQIERLTEDMVKALTVRKGPEVIAWHDLDPAQYAEHLADLAAWMQTFLAAYPSAAASVRDCWQAHRHAVTELGLIWCEFTRIYTAERPASTKPSSSTTAGSLASSNASTRSRPTAPPAAPSPAPHGTS